MHKKFKNFVAQKENINRRQLIAASEFAKNPEAIAELSRKLAFVREEKGSINARKR